VTVWGELRGEKKMRGVLRVRVGGEAAGAVYRDGPAWVSQSYTVRGYVQPQQRRHDSVHEALAIVVRSSWARKLGARAASDLHWSDRARRAASRAAVSQ
jgi:hypothetical protein